MIPQNHAEERSNILQSQFPLSRIYRLLGRLWQYLLEQEEPTTAYKTYRQVQLQPDPHSPPKVPQATYIGVPARMVVSKRGLCLVVTNHMKRKEHHQGAVLSICLERL
jgi:hypothetical protein